MDTNNLINHLNDELLERIKYQDTDKGCNNGFIFWQDIEIVLSRFRTPFVHDSDCGVHNEPAEPNIDCNCKFRFMSCMPNGIDTKEKHEQYLKDIGLKK